MDKFYMWIAWNLIPKRIRYWVVLRAGADATMGKWSNVEVPTLKFFEVLERVF